MSLIERYKAEAAKWSLISKREQVKSLAEAGRNAIEAVEAAKAERNRTQSDSASGLKEVDKLKSELEPITSKMMELENRIKVDSAAAETANTTSKQLSLHKLELELVNLKKIALEQHIAIYSKVQEIEVAQSQTEEVNIKVGAAEKHSAGLSSELERLTADCDLLQAEIIKNWPDLDTSTNDPLDMDKLMQEVAREKSISKISNLKLLDAEAAINKLKRDLSSLQAREEGISMKDAQLGELNKQFEETRAIIERQQTELVNKTQTVNRLSSDLHHANTQFNKKNMAADMDRIGLQNQISSLEAQLKQNLKDAAEDQVTVESRIGEIHDLEEDKAHLVKDLRDKDATIDRLNIALDNCRIRIEELSAQSSSTSEAAVNDETTSNSAEKSSVDDYKTKFEVERSINEVAAQENSKLQAEMNNLKLMINKQHISDNAKLEQAKVHEALTSATKKIDSLTATVEEDIRLKKELTEKLTAAESTLLRQSAELENLKSTTKITNLNAHEQNQQNSVSTAEIDELKLKIEKMMPLYDVGFLVRTRRLEMCFQRHAQNLAITKAGIDIALHGAALADATLFLNSAIQYYNSPAVFEKRYGVSASFVWENRAFGMLLDVLSMKMGVNHDSYRLSVNRIEYSKECDGFLAKVVPHTGINTDEQVKNDVELFAIYNNLNSRFAAALDQMEQNKMRRFSSNK